MANTVQIKRGNNTSVNAHTGPSGELIYNLDTGRLHAQDGSTAGGNPHALISDVDLKANASVTISAGAGLTGGGTLEANRTLALSSASIASLSLADSAVQSVNGKTGSSITLTKADVGLSNVDNTSDASKPISTATQTALNAKANSSVTITAGSGLTGGGNLTANRTVALNAASIASLGKADTALQAPGGTTGQILAKSSNTTNDVAWVSSEAATAVSYAPQTLTPAQQVQARQNIQADHAYDTIAIVTAANVPAFANAIRTNGYYAAGDGGGALYKRVASEPAHAGKVQSAGGAWWELSEETPDVKMFGAKGDGVTDDTTAIQSAIDYIARSPFGGVATVGTGTFIITATINWKSNVSLIGQAQGGTVIKAQGTIGKMFSIKDIWAFGIQIENMRIEGIEAQTTGLWVEQTTPIGGGEVVGHAMLRNVQFLNHAYGLDGNGIYALFDSYFEKVDFFNCSGAGAVIEGSAMTMVGCSFRNCQYGMLIRYLDAGSIGGPRVVGGLFVGNTFDVVFGGQLIRPTQFYGCWFEQSANHVIATLESTRQNFLGLSFHGCLFQPGATSTGSGVITLPSFAGVVSFEDCTIVNAPYAAATLPDANWSAPIPNEGVYRVTSCIRTNGSSVWNVIRDVNSNSLINFRSIMANRVYANDAAAGAAGLILGDMYFNSSIGSISLKN